MNLDYTKEEVIYMTEKLPSLFGLSMENIKEKIDFYDYIGFHEIVAINPLFLIQSINLSYARYNYLTSRGNKITVDNFKRLFEIK